MNLPSVPNSESAVGPTSTWAESVKATIESSWNTRHENSYKIVEVHMVRWVNDDLGADNEFEALRTVLTNNYLFTGYEFLILDFEPSLQLSERVAKFLSSGNTKCLHIFFCSGHGNFRDDNITSYWLN